MEEDAAHAGIEVSRAVLRVDSVAHDSCVTLRFSEIERRMCAEDYQRVRRDMDFRHRRMRQRDRKLQYSDSGNIEIMIAWSYGSVRRLRTMSF